MRIISQNGLYDYPYEQSFLEWVGNADGSYALWVKFGCEKTCFAKYSNFDKVAKVKNQIKALYAGTFITNARLEPDFQSRMDELMRNGYGCCVIKDEESMYEYTNLNCIYHFPNNNEVNE